MHCPNCSNQILKDSLTKQGVLIDHCPVCKGIWLDEGEIFYFTKHPKKVAKLLNEALKDQKPSYKKSPKTGNNMNTIRYANRIQLEYCPDSKGIWFDNHELKTLLEYTNNIQIEIDKKAQKTNVSYLPYRPSLEKLPNLTIRSIFMLGGLYALLGIILITSVEFFNLGLELALLLGISIALLQFLLGPILTDLTLRFLYRIHWPKRETLPSHLSAFIEKVSQEKKIKFPRIGILDDGAPQAFTYGHSPNNARIVISRGILELLEPEEVEAVVAHEIGHAVHWDMFLMTVAQLVPLISYYIYKILIRRSSSNSRGQNARYIIAIGAYITYIISEYVVLWFSRTREYHADRFSGEVTGNPAYIASALVKIGYGLAQQEGTATEENNRHNNKRQNSLESINAFGIFNANAAKSLAIISYNPQENKEETTINIVKQTMRWDLWNPWAKWYEINSTHPLIANRLHHLSEQSLYMRQEPYIIFDEKQPESYWDEFFVDLLIYLLPTIVFISIIVFILQGVIASASIAFGLGVLLITWGGALLYQYLFSYRGDYFYNMKISSLLKKVKVSDVRPVPCKVKGKIIGRGVPGYLFSEDFVLQDETGIILLDYKQPLAIWEFFFGLLKAIRYQGREVIIEGWYRRAPVPYIELKTIKTTGSSGTQNSDRSFVPFLKRFTAILFIVIGVILIFSTL